MLVVEEGKLRGAVSRADLLHRAVLAAMKREPWAGTFYTLVDVRDEAVELREFSSPSVQRTLKVLASSCRV